MKGKLYNVNIPGYVICHFTRSLRHKSAKRDSGGFLVLIKQKLKEWTTVSQTSEYVVWLTFSGKSALSHVGFVYIPPNYSTAHKLTDPFDELQNEIEIKRATGKVVISGDFNARTAELRDAIGNIDLNHYTILKNSRENDDKTVNSYGRKLIDLCKNNNMIILNGRTRSKYGCDNKGFTCYKYNGSSVVDYTIVEISAVKQITQFEIGGRRQESDHCHIVFNFRDNFDEIRAHKATKGAVFHFYKWDASRRRQYLESVNSPSTMQNYQQFLCDIIDINSNSDSVLNHFHNLITGAIASNFKKYGDKSRGSFPHNPWFDAECKQLKSQIHSLYKCDPNSTNTAKLCRRYKATTRRKKRQHFRHIAQKLQDLESTDPGEYRKFWKKQKKRVGQSCHISIDAFSTHFRDNSVPSFNGNFNHGFMKKLEYLMSNLKEIVNTNISEIQMEIMDSPIMADELTLALRKAKTGKACGSDAIPVEFYKYGGDMLHEAILALFNYIFHNGAYPEIWSEGIINPIFKAGNMSIPENYRKITLLSSLGKLFDSILNNRLCFCKDVLQKGDPLQNGFKCGIQTTDNLFILNGIIEKYEAMKRPIYTCFVDFKSAFDFINRHALLFKLITHGFGGRFFEILRDLFAKAKSRVKWDMELSEMFDNVYGVLQGGVISPSLFKFYIDDMCQYFHDISGVTIGNTSINHLLFADDLVLMSETSTGLQRLVNDLERYCRRWHLSLNISKTKIMIFNEKYEVCRDVMRFSFEGNPIEQVDSYKYLGVFLSCKKNRFKKHFAYIAEKANRAIITSNIYIRQAMRGELPLHLHFKVFDQQIRPIIEYASDIWCQKMPIEALETTQLKYLKKNVRGLPINSNSGGIWGDRTVPTATATGRQHDTIMSANTTPSTHTLFTQDL